MNLLERCTWVAASPVEEQPESKSFEASSRKRTHCGRGLASNEKIDLPGVLVGTARTEDGDGATAASASQNRWGRGLAAGGFSLSAGRRAAEQKIYQCKQNCRVLLPSARALGSLTSLKGGCSGGPAQLTSLGAEILVFLSGLSACSTAMWLHMSTRTVRQAIPILHPRWSVHRAAHLWVGMGRAQESTRGG
jgi:hypothetical protein